MKTCGACKAEKDDAEFPAYGVKCRDCRKAYYRDWYANNKDKAKAAQLRWRADPDNAAKHRASTAKWDKANADRRNELRRKRYHALKERRCHELQTNNGEF